MDVDLTVMPQGQRYEDRYRGYLDVFERIAKTPVNERVHVTRPPWSWVPLLRHLDCDMMDPQMFFEHCPAVRGALIGQSAKDFDRTLVEVLCSFRPETADALWKCDVQWATPRARRYAPVDEFIVTTNGAYHRPEVLHYMETLKAYQPTKKKVLLVPCAADKPYPSPMHQMCLDLLPDDFYLMNATGVVGLVPQDLWDVMPHYDSGIPNEWRLYQTVSQYFARHEHTRIVVYCDYYSEAIQEAFAAIGQYDLAEFILPVQFYADYVDLMSKENIAALRDTLYFNKGSDA